MANFFIRRPIVAIVISILIVMLGVVTIKGLSIEQYPFLAPPNIRVTANYTGASAVAVEQSVATPIEQEVNGVDRLIYMKSSNTSDGRMILDLNFEVGRGEVVALRTITPGETVGDLLIVHGGVKPGDRVIVDGIQKARPGSPVNPTTAPAPGQSSAKAEEKPAEAKAAKKGEGK